MYLRELTNEVPQRGAGHVRQHDLGEVLATRDLQLGRGYSMRCAVGTARGDYALKASVVAGWNRGGGGHVLVRRGRRTLDDGPTLDGIDCRRHLTVGAVATCRD